MNWYSSITLGAFIIGAIAIGTPPIVIAGTPHEKLSPAAAITQHIPATSISGKLPGKITLYNLDGHPAPFSRWRGRLLLINFWAPWCLPCREEIPALLKVQRKYGHRGFQAIGIAVDGPSDARRGARSLGITYPVLISQSPTKIIKLMDELGDNNPDGIPFSILISPNGHVIERHVGTYSVMRLERLIASYLPNS